MTPLADLSNVPREIEVVRPLSPASMIARGLALALVRRTGVIAGVPRAIVVRQRGVRLEAGRIAAFRRVCGFEGQAGGVPVTFPEILFTPLMAEAVLCTDFPLSPLGLIHVHQEVAQHAPLRPGDRADASAALAAVRPTDKGIEIDFALRLERAGEVIWTGLATLLSRARRSGAGRGDARAASGPFEGEEIEVEAGTGLAFARVSGDYNPHHLWRWTARPLGFRRPIAHGMWTFARVLAMALAHTDRDAPVAAWADFKRPLLMPGRARFASRVLARDARESPLAVRDARSGVAHLVGGVRWIG